MLMIFFYSPNSCALASHIALEHVGATYEARRVDFAKSEQRAPGFLAINPKGRVPALVTERGVLTETPAILAFICQTFPAAQLAPLDDVFAFAQVQCATVHVAHAHRYRGYRWADDPAAIEAMKQKVPQSVGDCFALIERDLFVGPYVMGSNYTVCDMYLFTVCQWLEGDGVDIKRFPNVAQHQQRMFADPVVTKVLAQQLA
jgi:glutathione S-transferase